MAHQWTYEENRVCCEMYVKRYVTEQSTMTLADFTREVKLQLPQLQEGSLRRKAQNTKALLEELQIRDTLRASGAPNYSSMHREAMLDVLRAWKLIEL